MRKIASMSVLAAAVAACATSQGAGPVKAARDPEALRAEREVARLSAERDELCRGEAARLLASLSSIADETSRRRAVVQALRLAPSWAVDLEPAEIAALAPDVLHVYDLSAVLDDGLDDGEVIALERPDRTFDGGDLLLQRIAGSVRAALPAAAWQAGTTTMEVAGECLLVVQSREAFQQVDAALDRFATVGGGAIRVSATATRGDETRTLAFDAPFGRRREAWNGTVTSFVKDFDVDAASGVADPRIDSIRDGVGAAAVYGPGKDGKRSLALDVWATEVTRPMPEFTTRLSDSIPGAVRVQMPEIRVQRCHYDLDVTSLPQTRVQSFGEGVVMTPEPPNIVRSPANWTVEVQVGAEDGAAPPRPGWRRVAATSTPRAPVDEPLVENAIALAGAQLAAPGHEDVAFTLRSATLGAREARWVRRARIGPDGTRAALVRRPVSRAPGDVLAAIRASDVTPAHGFGFLAVDDGVLVACVTPQSVGALRRALGAIERCGPASLRVSSANPAPKRSAC